MTPIKFGKRRAARVETPRSAAPEQDMDMLALDIASGLPAPLKHAFLASYPDPVFGVGIEQGYLTAWGDFTQRLERGGYLDAARRQLAHELEIGDPLARLRAAAYSLLAACDEIEREGA